MKQNISDPPATENSAASKQNEEATAATAASPVQPSPEISKTSRISPDIENHLRKAPENKAQVSPLIVEMVKVSDLKPHPENTRIYGAPQVNQRLLESIQAGGIRQPLVVNSDGTTLQGHSRLYAAQKLGWDEVPAILVNISDPDEQLEMLLSGNSQRDKTNEQRAREFKGYHDIETRRAKARQATNAGTGKDKGGPKSRKKAQPVENVSEGESGKARDIAAEKVGWSGPTAQSAVRVVDVIDALQKKDAESPALKVIRDKLATSVNAAFQECVHQKLFDDTAKAPTKNKAGAVQTEGFSRSGLSYAGRQFNPFGEAHKINDKAMSSLNVTYPAKSGDGADLASIVVLPSSMDLLHSDYTDDVVDAFADELEKAPQWICLVETSEFERATKFKWPENAWIGFSVSTQKEVEKAEEFVYSLRAKTNWIHCRLDSESLRFQKLDAFDWIVISVDNENLDWVDVEPILVAARKANCSVFFDRSVKCLPQELPKANKGK